MYLRRNIAASTFDVAIATAATPFVGAYVFDRMWSTKFSNPVPIPAFGLSGGQSVKIGPTNAHLLCVGIGDQNVNTYDMGRVTIDNQALFDTSAGASIPYSLAFDSTGAKLVTGGTLQLAQFPYAGSTIGPAFDWEFTQTANAGEFNKLFVVDDYVYSKQGLDITGGGKLVSNNRSDGTLKTSKLSGQAAFSLSLSTQPLASGNDVLAYVDKNFGGTFQLRLFEVLGTGFFNEFLTDTAIGTTYAGFATNNRLIIARPGFLDCYQMASDGALTLKFSTAWAGGTVTAMQYHANEEILFLGTDTAPFLFALPVFDASFGVLYPTPAPAPTSQVNDIAIRYNSWFNYSM